MASPLSGVGDSLFRLGETRRAKQSDALDALIKQAQLKEMGYQVEQKPGGFFRGGQTVLTQDPGFVSTKALERQKLQQDLEDQASARSMVFGGGASSGLKPKEIRFGGQTFEPANKLSASQELAKDKATKEIYENYEMDNARRGTLDKALEGSDKLPGGFLGKVRMNTAKAFPVAKSLVGINDQQIRDAQEMKMALTQGTLAETAYTKGAISDQEMMLFKEASANDDFNSPAIQPVLQKIRSFVDAGQAGRFGAYKQNYGEDPATWFGEGSQTPSFATPEEAEASGVKGPVLIAGRKAVIE